MTYDIQQDLGAQPDFGKPRRGRPPLPKIEDEQRSLMQHCALRLETALKLKAGVMDSDTRHLDIAHQLRSVVESVIEDLRAE